MWRGTSTLASGQARCQPCRRIRPTIRKTHPYQCEQCGIEFARKQGGGKYRFCSKQCVTLAQTVRHPDDKRVVRGLRENNAPGLVKSQRSKLLNKWIRQAWPCAYCPSPATTIDHVLSLVHGGTNWEGNLTPACRPCNSSKQSRTVMEWRVAKPAHRATQRLAEKPKRIPKPKPLKILRTCPVCGVQTTRRKYCTDSCQLEAGARAGRDRYRAAHGIPYDSTEPTKPHASRSILGPL